MKIALISAFPPSKVTLNEYGYYLVKHFVENPLVTELLLISDETTDEKTIDFPTYDKLKVASSWEFNSYTSVPRMLRTIAKHQPDVVIINGQFLKFGDKKIPAALGLMLPVFLKIMGKKTIFTIHNILEKVDLGKAGITKSAWKEYLFNKIGNLLTRCILVSDVVTVTIDKYITILQDKYKANNVVLIPHGCFEIPPPPDFTKTNDTKTIMAFGKFGTYKKVEEMIEAVELLRARIPTKMRIVVAGTDNPNVKGYLAGVATKYQHVSDLEFTGYVPESDVQRIFTESDVVVFPYNTTTGSSGVLHQAGSYGKAVALPHIDDLAHLVEEEGYRGAYFEPENAASLADALEKLVTDDDYRNELAYTNYKAATSLPMSDIVRWYLFHAQRILKK